MATVTGVTAARMLASEADSIVDARVDVDNLILTTRDGTDINVGNVRGAPGDSVGNVTELVTEDLNTQTTPGYFSQSHNVDAAAALNYPVPYAGMLQVIKNGAGNMVFQSFQVYGGSVFGGSVWTRSSYNGVWTMWVGNVGSGWTNLSLNANWSAYGSGYGVPAYKVEGSFVRLRGLCRHATGFSSANNIANVGATLAPKLREIFAVATSQAITTGAASAGTAHTHNFTGYTGRLDVVADGNLAIQASSSTDFTAGGWVSLDGVFWDWTA